MFLYRMKNEILVFLLLPNIPYSRTKTPMPVTATKEARCRRRQVLLQHQCLLKTRNTH
uniref:Uncharacterized protein n=1 Tax=Lepeophtheirus salmonis TaxID=72036 RepID=A0A0K2U9H8_LEPSM